MPRHTSGNDFPPQIHPGIAMSCCSWGFVADFSALLMIINKNVEISSLEHQDEGGSLPTGQAQMSVSFHSWLQQQGCARHSQGAQSQLHQTLGAAGASAFFQHLHCWWVIPFGSQRSLSLWLPLSQTSPLLSHTCSTPPPESFVWVESSCNLHAPVASLALNRGH